MDFVDYYSILGISKNATADDIKKAYRKAARKNHPDLNPGDKGAHKKFQQLNEANEVLSDPEKRKKYDQYGKDWEHGSEFEKARQQSGSRQAYEEDPMFSGGDDDRFSSFFESLFGNAGGGGAGRQTKFRGQDFNASLAISLKDAYHTHKQTITINDKNIRITIPAGVENGQVLRLKGHGAPGRNGGPDGDLYITFAISPDDKFRRSGNDLFTTIPLDLYKAVLGGEVTIDTFDGKAKLKLQPETQNGTKTRLKGKGFPVYKTEDQFGDLYITYEIRIPTGLTEKQKALFTELSNL